MYIHPGYECDGITQPCITRWRYNLIVNDAIKQKMEHKCPFTTHQLPLVQQCHHHPNTTTDFGFNCTSVTTFWYYFLEGHKLWNALLMIHVKCVTAFA